MKTVPNRIVSRFWNRVKVLGPDECWPWIGKSATYEPDPNKRGGIAWMEAGEKRQYLAHVLSWIIEHDQMVPEGLMVRHLCHSPSCCNPKHLKVGTFGDNVQDNIDVGKHWGKPGPKNDAVDEMHMLRDSGFSITQIAEQVGWSRSAVWRHLNK